MSFLNRIAGFIERFQTADMKPVTPRSTLRAEYTDETWLKRRLHAGGAKDDAFGATGGAIIVTI